MLLNDSRVIQNMRSLQLDNKHQHSQRCLYGDRIYPSGTLILSRDGVSGQGMEPISYSYFCGFDDACEVTLSEYLNPIHRNYEL